MRCEARRDIQPSVKFSHSVVSNFLTPWIAACQASLSITNSQSLLRLMSIELVMPCNRLIFCHPILFLPSVFLSIRVFKCSMDISYLDFATIVLGLPRWYFSLVQSLSHVRLFLTPWTAALQASLSITNSQSLLKLMSIGSVIPSNHLILCRPLLPLPSIFPSIRVFSNESVLLIRWPKYWSFSFSISPSK